MNGLLSSPTVSPFVDIRPYVYLLVTAVDVHLNNRFVWLEDEATLAQEYMEELILWLMFLENRPNFAVVNFNSSQSTIPLVMFGDQGGYVAQIRLIIDVPFSPGTLIAIGDLGDPGRLMGTSDNDPTNTAEFENSPDYRYSGAETVQLTITGAPSSGQGRVFIFYGS